MTIQIIINVVFTVIGFFLGMIFMAICAIQKNDNFNNGGLNEDNNNIIES